MRRVALGFVALLCVAAEDADVRRGLVVPVDYLQFWSTGYLTVRGENPYDSVRLFELQRTVYPEFQYPIISWHPPFGLVLNVPFGLLPVVPGYLLWIGLQTACVLAAAVLLWKAGGGTDADRWVAVVLALAFAPTLIVVMMAQVTPVCLLGLAGFAWGARANRPVLAGLAVALTAWKPHLLGVFGLVLILDATRSRFSRVAVLTGGGVLLAAFVAVAAINPRVPGWYAAVLAGTADPPMPYKPADAPSPTVGCFLREYVATGDCISRLVRLPPEVALPTGRAVVPGSLLVQLIPFAVLAAAAVGVWVVRRKTWDWVAAIPWLVLASMVGTPYGSWTFDFVLLLAVIIPTAARLRDGDGGRLARNLAVGWYVAVSGGMFLALKFSAVFQEPDFVVVVPFAALGLALVRWAAARGGSRTMLPRTAPNGGAQ